MKISRIFLDTSFFIRLYTPEYPDHANARAYLEYFLLYSDVILLSTVVAAEFGVGESIDSLPLDNFKVRVVPFNLVHARQAAIFARHAYEARRKGSVITGKRVVIPNDTKILAQAQVEQTDCFLGRDDNCESVCKFLREAGLITFSYVDIRTDPRLLTGQLF